jgi:hypothetical protein
MKDTFEITFDEIGITLKENLHLLFKLWAFLQGKPVTKIQSVRWSDVSEVCVYKRDVFAYDLICLAFRTNNGDSVELNEQMNGWKSLIDNLLIYIPGCRKSEEWFIDVAFPAFELNLIKIYQREN